MNTDTALDYRAKSIILHENVNTFNKFISLYGSTNFQLYSYVEYAIIQKNDKILKHIIENVLKDRPYANSIVAMCYKIACKYNNLEALNLLHKYRYTYSYLQDINNEVMLSLLDAIKICMLNDNLKALTKILNIYDSDLYKKSFILISAEIVKCVELNNFECFKIMIKHKNFKIKRFSALHVYKIILASVELKTNKYLELLLSDPNITEHCISNKFLRVLCFKCKTYYPNIINLVIKKLILLNRPIHIYTDRLISHLNAHKTVKNCLITNKVVNHLNFADSHKEKYLKLNESEILTLSYFL